MGTTASTNAGMLYASVRTQTDGELAEQIGHRMKQDIVQQLAKLDVRTHGAEIDRLHAQLEEIDHTVRRFNR